MRLMKQMGYHTVGVGDKDLGYGLGLFRDSTHAAGLNPVSANLVDLRTGKLAFPSYAIEEVAGVKIGIFSVMGQGIPITRSSLNAAKDSLKVLPESTAVEQMIAELRPKVDVLVGILNVGNKDAEELAGKYSGMDVALVGALSPRFIPKGTLSGTCLVVSGENRGRNLSETIVTVRDHKVVNSFADVVPLDVKIPEHPVFANLRKQFEDNLNETVAKRQQQMDMADAKLRGPDHYMGLEACTKCHLPQYKVWSGTAHAKAFDTLVKNGKDNMPECVKCHVTGFRENGGYFSNLNPGLEVNGEKRSLRNVQCEVCHGMGTQHNTSKSEFVNTPRTVCATCHTPEQDPTFNFDKAWAKIAH